MLPTAAASPETDTRAPQVASLKEGLPDSERRTGASGAAPQQGALHFRSRGRRRAPYPEIKARLPLASSLSRSSCQFVRICPRNRIGGIFSFSTYIS